MSGQSGSAPVNLQAVGAGILWGLGLILLGAIGQGVVQYISPLSPQVEGWTPLVWQCLGGTVAGFMAARKASGSGWLHGVLAGIGLTLSLTIVMGIAATLPSFMVMMKATALSTGTALIGGVMGVNSR